MHSNVKKKLKKISADKRISICFFFAILIAELYLQPAGSRCLQATCNHNRNPVGKVALLHDADHLIPPPGGRQKNSQPPMAVAGNIPLLDSSTGPDSRRQDTPPLPPVNQTGSDWFDELLEKIWQVESSGKLSPEDGDGGEAVGPLQIHQCVLDDVNEKFGTQFTLNDVRDIETAKIVARLYVSMWMDIYKTEIASRIFNGGPRGWRKESTDSYWRDILEVK